MANGHFGEPQWPSCGLGHAPVSLLAVEPRLSSSRFCLDPH